MLENVNALEDNRKMFLFSMFCEWHKCCLHGNVKCQATHNAV